MRVKYDYEGADANELTIHVGDVVTVVEQDDNGWWMGELRGVLGHFPSNFCEEVLPEPGEADAEKEKEAEPPTPTPTPTPAVTPASVAVADKPPVREGPLRVHLRGAWKSGHGVVRDNALVVLDEDRSTELGRADVKEAVKRGAPPDVKPPPGEENCQFSLGTLMLSAPSFSESLEWMTTLKSFNKSVQLARIATEARISNDAAAGPAGTPKLNRPDLSPAKESSTPVRGKRLSTIRLGGKSSESATGSPGTMRKSGGVASAASSSSTAGSGSDTDSEKGSSGLDALQKRAADLLFRRKERKEHKKAKEPPDQTAWPDVGRVRMQTSTSPASTSGTVTPASSSLSPANSTRIRSGSSASPRGSSEIPKESNIVQQQIQKEVVVKTVYEANPEHEKEIQRLKRELQNKTEELERAQAASAMHADSYRQQVASTQEELQNARQLAELDVQQARSEAKALEEALQAKTEELDALRKESENYDDVVLQHEREKEENAMEIKTQKEAMERAKQKIEVLMGEKMLNRTTIKELQEQLEKHLQMVFAETARVEQLESELKQVQEDRSLAEASGSAKSKEIDSLMAICEDQKASLEALTSRTDNDSIVLSQLRAEVETVRGLLKTNTTELEHLRSDSAAELARRDIALAQKQKELDGTIEKSEREIEKLKRSVDAVSSGRGRLEQLTELQAKLDATEREYEETKAELEEKIANLSAENEALAESNQQLITALEGGGEEDGDKLAGAFSVLEVKAWEERSKVLEGEISAKTAALETAAAAEAKLTAELEACKRDVADKVEKIFMLVDRVKMREKELQLLNNAMATAKESAEVKEKETQAKMAASAARIADMETKNAELSEKLAGLEARLKEAERVHEELERFKAKTQAESEETAAEILSIRERLNEAIQERWLTVAKLEKVQKDAEKLAKQPGRRAEHCRIRRSRARFEQAHSGSGRRVEAVKD